MNDARKRLRNVLKHFLKVHKVPMEEEIKILESFTLIGPIKCILISFPWSGSKLGYANYFFLHLRWLLYLTKSHKLYSNVYEISTVINCYKNTLNDCMSIRDSYSVEDYFMKRKFYENTLGKIRVEMLRKG